MDNPLVQLDPGLFIWTLLTFLVLFALLWKFAWGPLLKMLDARQETIRKALDDAEQVTKELAEVQLESEAIVNKARVQADGIISDTRADATRLREELRQKAQAEAQSIITNAERQIQLETDRALAQVRQEAVDVSLMIASKLIRRNLTKADNEALIDDALKQVESQQTS